MPVIAPNNSPARWPEVALPEDEKLIVPGLALASAISSRTLFAGSEGLATRMLLRITPIEIGVKSLIGSKGSDLYSVGEIARIEIAPMKMV